MHRIVTQCILILLVAEKVQSQVNHKYQHQIMTDQLTDQLTDMTYYMLVDFAYYFDTVHCQLYNDIFVMFVYLQTISGTYQLYIFMTMTIGLDSIKIPW